MPDPLSPFDSSFVELVRRSSMVLLGDLDDAAEAEFDIPQELLSVFARSYETSAALASMPVYAMADIGDLDATAAAAPKSVSVPLGQLGTDHVGYASFDLAAIRTESTMHALLAAGIVKAGQAARLGLRHLWVFPFGDPLLVVDALQVGDLGPRAIVLRLELDLAQIGGRVLEQPLTSMQYPSILDWRLSPGSFTLAGALLVGESGCESFVPSNLSTQRFRFSQVARVPDTLYEKDSEHRVEVVRDDHRETIVERVVERFRLGRIFEYTTEWFPIGHSLGPLAYSLPLAPGEIVNVAVIDWSRADAGTRDEQTSLSESLLHDQFRDRSITESVHAVLEEWQRGGSVMGGVAGSGGYGGGGMGIGGAASLGGAYTTSSGSRDLAVDTAQRIADAFHQSTSAMRELRSTVVVQTSQAEKASAQTRVVANYNHSHAMTILYYEVLRHYRVVTRLSRSFAALLVDFAGARFDFDDEGTLLAHRQELESVLLDQRLKPCFDALSRVLVGRESFEAAKKLPSPPGPGDAVIDRLQITLATGDDGGGGTDGDPYVNLKLADGRTVHTHQIEPNDSSDPRLLGKPGYNDFESGDRDDYGLRPTEVVTWKNLRGFVIGLDGGGDWRIDDIRLEGFTAGGDSFLLYSAGFGKDLPDDTETVELVTIKPPPPPAGPTIESFVAAADLQAVSLLVRHLTSHRTYYDRALWLNEDPNARALRFESLALNSEPVLDLIENRAVEISGNWVAFPLASGAEDFVDGVFERRGEQPEPQDTFVEQLLTLPSRGVFAEAKLGHCNASELIDPTRFWDWQTSPIPHHPPTIAAVDTASRARDLQGLDATEFPASLVNIVNPSPAPDPTGMAGALKAISTPDIFRDMSAVAELGSLLEKLSDNATQLASQGMKQGMSSGDREKLLDDIRGAEELTPEQRSKLVGDLLQKEVGGQDATASGGDSAPGRTVVPPPPSTVDPSGPSTPSQDQHEPTPVTPNVKPGGGTPAKPPPQPTKLPRTETVPPGKVRVVVVFSGFQEVGSIRTVWGTLAGNNGAADGIPEGAPYAGMKNYLCNHITGPGSMSLFVQLADDASTMIEDATPFTPDANNVVTVRVRPKLYEVEVEDTSELSAKAKAELSFKNSIGAEIPIRIIKAKVEDVFDVGVGGEVSGSKSTKQKYKFVILRKGLDFS